MSIEFNLEKNAPTEQTHPLTVDTLVLEKSYEDEQSQGKLGNVTRPVVVFKLHESSETYRMIAARLAIPGKLIEMLIRIDHPFHQHARVALMHPKSQDPDGLLDEIHLFLMSYGLTQIIIGMPSLHGKPLEIVVLPESDDHPDGCPTDGIGEGDDLYSGTRREIKTGLENQKPPELLTPHSTPDRHGRVFPPLKG